jgi:hypothetical protein
LIRELWEYAQRHPFKAFMAVVVPLISAGGALHEVLKQFGVRIPFGLESMFATRTRGGYGSGGYGAGGYGAYEGGYGDGMGNMFGGGSMDTVGSLLKVARVFM